MHETAAAGDATPRVKKDRAPTDNEVFEHIYRAIVQQKLTPGTKLGEEALCEVFGVSRARIRRVLLSLSNRQLIDLIPNRGAYVARPTAKEARHVFEARRTIEPTIVRRCAERMSDAHAERLAKHIAEERKAHAAHDREAAIALSGDFHVLLAELAGNEVLAEFLGNLVTRTSLIIGLYGVRGGPDCSYQEHAEIAAALEAGDSDRACTLIEDHLRHTEEGLRLSGRETGEIDLAKIFGR